MPVQASQPRKLHPGWIVLFAGTLAIFGVLGLGRFGYTMVLPSMQSSLVINNAQAGLLATANLLGYLLMTALGGILTTRFGGRIVIAAGCIVAGAGMLFTGLAHSVAGVVIWRALTGLGAGAANVSVMGMIPSWFAKSRRGLAAGIAVSGSSVALIITGPLVPALLSAYGPEAWRTCWTIFGVAALAMAVVSWFLIKNKPAELGLRQVGAAPTGAEPTASAATDKIPWSKVYGSGRVWYLGLTYFTFGFSYIIFMTFFTKHLVTDAGYTKTAAGSLFMAVGWLSLFCGLIWGWLSDRIGRKWALLALFLTQAIAYGLFTMSAAPAALTAAAILFGLTAWSIPAVMSATCGDTLGSRMAPAAYGFITLFHGTGQAIGPTIAGKIADVAQTFAPAFFLAAGVALAGGIMSALLRGETAKPR